MKTMQIIFSFLILFTFITCGKKSSNLDFKVNQGLGQAEEVSFSQIKTEVLEPHCLSCHATVATEANLKKWITPGDPDQSPFFTTVENGSMPKNQAPLNSRSLDLIRNYITQMAPPSGGTSGGSTGGTSGGSAGGTTGGSSGITYEQIKAAVLVPYRCVNCHSVGTEAKLAKWINTTTPERSPFYTTIKNGSMPQGGADVSAENTALVLQYVQDFSNR